MAESLTMMDEAPQQRQVEQPRNEAAAAPSSRLNPALPVEGERQFLFYSRGLHEVGKGIGTLFKDIGEAAKETVHGVDTFFKNRIRDEMHGQVDQIRDDTEARLMGGLPGQSTSPPPANLKQTMAGLGNMRTAAAQGNIPHVYYEMQLNSVAKSMRAQYPGYRDYIDQEISHMTGGNPANKIIQDLFHATQAGTKSDHQENMWWHLYQTNVQQVPGFLERFNHESQSSGQRPSLEWMSKEANDFLGKASQTKKAIDEYKLAKDQGQATEEATFKAATSAMAFARNNALASGPLFANTKALREMTDQVEKSGVTMSNDQFIKAQALTNQIRTQIKAIEAQTLTDPLFEHLTPKQIEDLKKSNDDYIDMFTNMFTGKTFNAGWAHAAANIVDYSGHADELSILGASEGARLMKAMSKAMGPQVASQLLNFKLGDPVVNRTATELQVLLTKGLSSLTLAGNDAKSLSNVVTEVGPKKAGAVDTVVTKAMEALNSQDANPEGLANLVKNIYAADSRGENFLTRYDDTGKPIIPSREERDKLFQTLTSPKTIDRIKQLKDQGVIGSEHWYALEDFVTKVTRQNLKQDIEALRETNTPTSFFRIVFDPQTNRFSSLPNDRRQSIGPDPFGYAIDPSQQKANADTTARRLNVTIAPAIKMNEVSGAGPEVVHQKLDGLFKMLGLDVGMGTLSEEDRGLEAPKGREGKFGGKKLIKE